MERLAVIAKGPHPIAERALQLAQIVEATLAVQAPPRLHRVQHQENQGNAAMEAAHQIALAHAMGPAIVVQQILQAARIAEDSFAN
jgi:hypothetical protein